MEAQEALESLQNIVNQYERERDTYGKLHEIASVLNSAESKVIAAERRESDALERLSLIEKQVTDLEVRRDALPSEIVEIRKNALASVDAEVTEQLERAAADEQTAAAKRAALAEQEENEITRLELLHQRLADEATMLTLQRDELQSAVNDLRARIKAVAG